MIVNGLDRWEVIRGSGKFPEGNFDRSMPFIDESETPIDVQMNQIRARHIKSGDEAEVIFRMYPGFDVTPVFEKKLLQWFKN